MNNSQLEFLLNEWKSSSREPDTVDERLEQRIIKESLKMKSKRRTIIRVATFGGVLVICGTGFIASAGDTTWKHYFVSTSEDGSEESSTVSHLHAMLRHIHDFLWSHGPKQLSKQLHDHQSTTSDGDSR